MLAFVPDVPFQPSSSAFVGIVWATQMKTNLKDIVVEAVKESIKNWSLNNTSAVERPSSIYRRIVHLEKR